MGSMKQKIRVKKTSFPSFQKIALYSGGIFLLVLSYFFFFSSQLQWKEGGDQRYSFTIKTSTRGIDYKAGNPSNTFSEISGILNMKIYNVSNGIAKVGLQLEPSVATFNGFENPLFKKVLSFPFYVDFSISGYPLSFHFPAEISREDEKMLKNIIYNFQFNGSRFLFWSREEKDGNGDLLSRYHRGLGSVKKTRTTSDQNRSEERDGDAVVSVLTSDFTYTLDSGWSWISSVKAREKVRITQENIQFLSVSTFSMTRAGKGLSDTCQLSKNYGEYEEKVSAYDSSDRNKNSIWDSMRLEGRKTELKEGMLASIISQFNNKKTNDLKFKNDIVDYLMLYPKEAFVLSRDIRSGKYSGVLAEKLLFSMAKAGNNESQLGITEVISDLSLNNIIRLKAAIYFSNVKDPSLDAVTIFKNVPLDFSGKDVSMLSSAMACSLGSVSATTGNTGPVAEQITSYFEQKLQNTSASVTESCAILTAVGNTGNDNFLPQINSFTKNSNSLVRGAAVSALVQMEGAAADSTMLSVIKSEKDPMVLARAVKTQIYRKDNDEITKELKRTYLSQDDETVKIAMIDYLKGYRNKDSEVKDIFEKALKNEKDLKVKTELYKAIYSEKIK